MLEHGHSIQHLSVVDTAGTPISVTSAHHGLDGCTYPTVAIHRGVLQRILLDRLAPETLTTGKQCVGVRAEGSGVQARFQDQALAHGSFLIGADGIHSCVRQSTFPQSTLRYSGQTCWRGIAHIDLPDEMKGRFTEVWGTGVRFGFVTIADNQVYWFATRAEVAGAATSAVSSHPEHQQQMRLEPLVDSYRHCFYPAPEILENTSVNGLIHNDLYDLKPLSSWYVDRVALMGDAAHATTPNLGQGGAQAIEDSWVLADCLAHSANPNEAFQRFQTLRFARARWVVDTSFRIGQITNLTHELACQARNALLRKVPAFISERQVRNIYTLPY